MKKRKIILYIAASLDGFIATESGGVEWLESIAAPEGEDYGYANFIASVDTVIMGYRTYQQVRGFEGPYPYQSHRNIVLSRQSDPPSDGIAEFLRDPQPAFINDLKRSEGKDIWLVGGGQVNTLFLKKGFLDEIRLFLMPILLGSGISLFPGLPTQCPADLVSERRFPNGVLELCYRFP